VDSNFLGIPEVSSSSWYGEFSEGLFRAIAFGLYGIRQGVNCGDGFCRRSIGVNGLVMELAMRESWGDGEELHIHTGELVFCQAKFPEIITENSRFLTREFPDYYRPPGRLIKTAKNRYFPPLNPSIPMLSANLMNSIDSQEDQPHTISLAVLSESHTGL
jgi:hypothetical protein